MQAIIIGLGQITESFSLEELMLAREQYRIIDRGYQDLKIPTPDGLMDKLSEIGNEITMRVRAELQRRLKNAKSRRLALATADEKRKTTDAEIEELEKMLE